MGENGRVDMARDLATWERRLLAANKHATLTLGELRDFIARLDDEGAAESTPLSGKTSFRGRRLLLRLTADIVRFGDRDEARLERESKAEAAKRLAEREASLRASGVSESAIRMMRP